MMMPPIKHYINLFIIILLIFSCCFAVSSGKYIECSICLMSIQLNESSYCGISVQLLFFHNISAKVQI